MGSYWADALVTSYVRGDEGEVLNGFWATEASGNVVRLSLSREGFDWARAIHNSLSDEEQQAFELTRSRAYFPSEWFKYSSEQRKLALDLLYSAQVLYGGKSVKAVNDLEALLRRSYQPVASLGRENEASAKRVAELEANLERATAYFKTAEKHIALLEAKLGEAATHNSQVSEKS
jgi:hypothetical protein